MASWAVGKAADATLSKIQKWANEAREAGDRWDEARHEVRRTDRLIREAHDRVANHPGQFDVPEAFEYGRVTGHAEKALQSADERTQIRPGFRPNGFRQGARFNKEEMRWAQKDLARENRYLEDTITRQDRASAARHRDTPPPPYYSPPQTTSPYQSGPAKNNQDPPTMMDIFHGRTVSGPGNGANRQMY